MILAAPLHVLLLPESGDLGRFLAGTLTGAGVAGLLGTRIRYAAVAAVFLTLLAATRSDGVFLAFSLLTPAAFAFSLFLPLARFAAPRPSRTTLPTS